MKRYYSPSLNLPKFTFNHNIHNDLNKLYKHTVNTIPKLLKIKNPTWENFIDPIRDIVEQLDDLTRCDSLYTTLGHYDSENLNKYTKKLNDSYDKKTNDISNLLFSNKKIYNTMQQLYHCTTDVQQQAWLKHIIKSLEYSGINLSESDKKTFDNVRFSIGSVTQDFDKNIIQICNEQQIKFKNKSALRGIPEHWLLERKTANNTWTLDLSFETFSTVLTCCECRETRKQFFNYASTVGTINHPIKRNKKFANEQNVMDIVNYHTKLGKLQGYDSYMDLKQQQCFFSTKQTEKFLNDLTHASLMKRSNETTKQYFNNLGKKYGITDVEDWDVDWLIKMDQREQNNDTKKLAKYLPKKNVIERSLLYIENLFNIKFIRIDTTIDPSDPRTVHVWDKTVDFYEVHYKGEVCGGIYFDWHSRPEKIDRDISMFVLRRRNSTSNKKIILPLVYVSCDFSQTHKLNLYDVSSIFHEIGHCLHDILPRINYGEISGSNTQVDVIEVPSILLEKISLQHETIKFITYNDITKKSAPDNVIKQALNYIKESNHLENLSNIRKALFNLKLFSSETYFKKYEDITKLEKSITQILPYNDVRALNICPSDNYGISGGYIGTYYTYILGEYISHILLQYYSDKKSWKKIIEHIYLAGGIDTFKANILNIDQKIIEKIFSSENMLSFISN